MHSLQHIEKLLQRPELRKWDRDAVANAVLILRSLRGQGFDTGGDLRIGAQVCFRGWAGYCRCSAGVLTCAPTPAGIAYARATMLAVLGEMALAIADARGCGGKRLREMDPRSRAATVYALRAGLRANHYVTAMQQAHGTTAPDRVTAHAAVSAFGKVVH